MVNQKLLQRVSNMQPETLTSGKFVSKFSASEALRQNGEKKKAIVREFDTWNWGAAGQA